MSETAPDRQPRADLKSGGDSELPTWAADNDADEPIKFVGFNVPLDLYLALAARAKRHERSLSAELRHLLRKSIEELGP